jgi:hypothetical protein
MLSIFGHRFLSCSGLKSSSVARSPPDGFATAYQASTGQLSVSDSTPRDHCESLGSQQSLLSWDR